MSATEKIHTDMYSLFKLNKEVSGNGRFLRVGLHLDIYVIREKGAICILFFMLIEKLIE